MNQTVQTSTTYRPGMRLAMISSRWHADIVARARDAFCETMIRHGWPPDTLVAHEVPGAFEIPLRAQRLARSGGFVCIVAFGMVVDGGIYRHDFVARAVIDGLMRVQLDTEVPVLSVVLTPQAFHEHDEHRRFFDAHFVKKGEEAALACQQVLAPDNASDVHV
jgi:6,7-dimethyl-8-ribityllumazine synthase